MAHQKLRKKLGFPGGGGSMQKRWKIPGGVTLNLIKNSKDQLQENSQQEGGAIFFLEKPITSSQYQFSRGDRTRDLSILNSTP